MVDIVRDRDVHFDARFVESLSKRQIKSVGSDEFSQRLFGDQVALCQEAF